MMIGGSGRYRVEGAQERPMAILDSACAIRLRDQSVQAEHESGSKESDRGEKSATDADRADGNRADTADHNGIDQAHGDPAEFSGDHRKRQAEHGRKFPAELGKHGLGKLGDDLFDPGGRTCPFADNASGASSEDTNIHWPGVVEHCCGIDKSNRRWHVRKTALVAVKDICVRNVVTALRYSQPHALNVERRIV